jgi:very-short-patch-repair endonuclease
MDLLRDPGLHVSAPHRVRTAELGVIVHRAAVPPAETCRVTTLRVTSPARTLVDSCRALPWEESVVLMDSALRSGLSSAELERVAAAASGRGSAAVRAAAAAVDVASESALETLLRLLLASVGLRPVSQVVISDEHGCVARVDFLFPEHRLVIEADGFAFHGDRAATRRDRRRTNALIRAGYRVVRFGCEEVRYQPHDVVSIVVDLVERG